MSFQITYCVIFLFINLSTTDGGLTCLSCKHVVQPGDCFKLTTCGDHEQCYLRRYVTSSGTTWYDVGCLDNTKCAAISGLPQTARPTTVGNSRTLPPSIIGKRQNEANMTQSPITARHYTLPPSIIGKRQDADGETTLCEHCCNSSTICNTGGYCGSLSLNNPGPICYSCKEAQTADSCDQIVQCGEDEKCFIGQVFNRLSQEKRWTHGCKSNKTCVYTQGKRDIDDGNSQVCEECCEDHLCNNVCTNFVDWNAPFTTPTDNITSAVPTSPSFKTASTTAMSTLEIIKTTLLMTKTKLPTAKTTALPTTKTTSLPTTETPTTKIPTTKSTTIPTTELATTTIPTTTTTTVPTTTLDPVVMVNCNFEAGLCNWHQDKMDDGDWRIHSGPTATDKTGPDSDHTLGNEKGHYLYIEASDMNYQNFVRLLSNNIVWPQRTCLTFWYHMYGHFIASLSVYIKDSDGNLQKLWSQSENHGNNWLPAKINLPDTPGQIVIEGYRGADIHGDIAIDDITLVRNCGP
ncbi:integumentary mucin C.1-like [Mytilus trossulus]|uniref:integumentary mucin C.1-like n=1 Tax=Mytilus trossulus TaxID=6551 RepID=UPI0030050528